MTKLPDQVWWLRHRYCVSSRQTCEASGQVCLMPVSETCSVVPEYSYALVGSYSDHNASQSTASTPSSFKLTTSTAPKLSSKNLFNDVRTTLRYTAIPQHPQWPPHHRTLRQGPFRHLRLHLACPHGSGSYNSTDGDRPSFGLYYSRRHQARSPLQTPATLSTHHAIINEPA